MGQLTSFVAYSSSLEQNSLASRLLIQALLQSLAGVDPALPISAITVERSGGDWYLWVQQGEKPRSRSCKLLASSIQINGKSLAVCLGDIVERGILNTSLLKPSGESS